jgi:alpha-glucosidase
MFRHSQARLSFIALIAMTMILAGMHSQASKGDSPTQNPPLPTRLRANGPDWWRRAVFCEIYPRSFMDSNGDGIGDLNGITSKLDYLANLGIDAIWITPFYPSPQVDFGYDISDYENVDPQFGTLQDLDRLVAAAHQRHIRVIMDMVLNHTSDQHPWFKESRSSRDNPKRDWYIWRDGRNGGPPNNWVSDFGGSAWTYDKKTGQYYYHYFYAQQPDLNWRNPEVEKAMFGAVRFWLKRGVDGFRLDALDQLFEDPQLRDNPVLYNAKAGAQVQENEIYNRDLPEIHDVLERLRKVTDSFNPPTRILIGEIWVNQLQQLREFYGPRNDEVQLPFNFFFTKVPKLDAAAFRQEVLDNQRVLGNHWTTYVLSNHDIVRALTRYGDRKHNPQIAKLLATMLLTLRGTPFIYYGEEIGMVNHDPKTIEEVRDPVGRRFWPKYKGRDGERTPMQWTPGPNAGFTTGKPWLPVPSSAKTSNVETESAVPSSILSYYEALLRLRRQSEALQDGAFENLGDDPNVFAYRRAAGGQAIVVALNMSGSAQTLSGKILGTSGKTLKVILSSLRTSPRLTPASALRLKPYESVVIEEQ